MACCCGGPTSCTQCCTGTLPAYVNVEIAGSIKYQQWKGFPPPLWWPAEFTKTFTDSAQLSLGYTSGGCPQWGGTAGNCNFQGYDAWVHSITIAIALSSGKCFVTHFLNSLFIEEVNNCAYTNALTIRGTSTTSSFTNADPTFFYSSAAPEISQESGNCFGALPSASWSWTNANDPPSFSYKLNEASLSLSIVGVQYA